MMLAGQIALLVIIGGPLIYLCLLSVLAFGIRRQSPPRAGRKSVFAVVVPAHNEELSIAQTVQNLRALQYPPELFDVIVIADNCADRTAELARALGAIVLERASVEERGKGYALRWGFDRILSAETRYDAVVVCDADTSVDLGFLSVMDAYLAQGAFAIQCSDQVWPAPGAWSAEAIRLGFLLYNYVRPAGRKRLGFSAGLRGNGMCFAASLLRSYPWGAYSKNEDLEYGLDLLLHNVKVVFAPEATVFATMPHDARNAESQRARWEGGRFGVIRKYARALFVQAVKQRSVVVLDGLIDLLTPALVNLMIVSLTLLVLDIVLWQLGVASAVPAAIWATVFAAGIGHVVLGAIAAGQRDGMIRLFRHVPRYVFWKLGLYARMATSAGTDEWVRTARESVRGNRKGERS
jgi:cellulose synthase/poly-beta-1,6-N-acetylglucosamine synthase-like glycosyltransferase